jgi:ribose transport system permease protein
VKAVTGAPAQAEMEGRRARRQRLVDRLEQFGLVIAWALVIIIFGALRPETFLSWPNFSTILGSQAVLVVITLALIIPLTAGDFDLSLASVLTLSSMMIAVLNVNHGVPIGVAVLAALAMGLVTGFVNGFFIIYFRIHSLIVTLGIGTFLHGITLWISDSMTLSGIDFALVNRVIVWRFLGVPLAFYYALLLCIVIWYVFTYTAVGRRLLFVGRGRGWRGSAASASTACAGVLSWSPASSARWRAFSMPAPPVPRTPARASPTCSRPSPRLSWEPPVSIPAASTPGVL